MTETARWPHRGFPIYRRGDAVGSSARQLATASPKAALNREILDSIPSFRLPPNSTVFEGVSRLNAWESLDGPLVWKVPRDARRKPPEDLPARIWRTLVDEVAIHLRRCPRAAVLLSGGIDSAAIAAASAEAARREGLAEPLLLTYSFAGLASDETDAARETAKHLRLPWKPIAASDLPLEPHLDHYVREHDSPLIDPEETVVRTALGEAAAAGCRIVFTGNGADELFGARGADVDLLRRFRLIRAAQRQSSVSQASRSSFLRMLALSIRQAFRAHPYGAPPTHGSQVRSVYNRLLTDGTLIWRMDMAARTAELHGLEFVHPFLAPSVIDSALSADPATLAQPPYKSVLRKAASPALPAGAASRVEKVDHRHYLMAAARRERESWKRRLGPRARELEAALDSPVGVVDLWLVMTRREFEASWNR